EGERGYRRPKPRAPRCVAEHQGDERDYGEAEADREGEVLDLVEVLRLRVERADKGVSGHVQDEEHPQYVAKVKGGRTLRQEVHRPQREEDGRHSRPERERVARGHGLEEACWWVRVSKKDLSQTSQSVNVPHDQVPRGPGGRGHVVHKLIQAFVARVFHLREYRG